MRSPADGAALKPSKKVIEDTIAAVLKGCGKGDTVVVALAGHGFQFDKHDDAFFCPADGQPFDDETATLVSLKTLYTLLDKSKAGMKVLFVDACRNDPKAKRGGVTADSLKPPEGIAALFSCKARERAYETKDLGHGVFFHHVLEGLNGKAKDDEGVVTFAALAGYVSRRTTRYVEDKIGDGATQSPTLKADYSTEPVLVRLTAGGGGTVPKKDPPAVVVAGKEPKPLKAPFSAEQAKAAQKEWAAYLGRKVVEEIALTDKVTMKFVLIPPGTYTMGSPKGESDTKDEDQHEVEITKPFYLAATETTQKQYTAFGDKNPSQFKGDELPVETVSWDDADRFCKKLTDRVKPEWGKLFNLPTEAQWEYACRAGTATPFHFGKELTEKDANFGSRENQPAKAGTYKPNAFGLYDMHGNVLEWCEDWYDEYGKVKGKSNPVQTVKNSDARVFRGGSWGNSASRCRAASRSGGPPTRSIDFLGFRVAFCLD